MSVWCWFCDSPAPDYSAVTVTPRQLLQRPRPRNRGSGFPSPVLKLAWHLMHTYILELDIMGFTPGSACGRAAVYSACVWRSLGPLLVSGVVGERRVVMAGGGREGRPNRREATIVLGFHAGRT